MSELSRLRVEQDVDLLANGLQAAAGSVRQPGLDTLHLAEDRRLCLLQEPDALAVGHFEPTLLVQLVQPALQNPHDGSAPRCQGRQPARSRASSSGCCRCPRPPGRKVGAALLPGSDRGAVQEPSRDEPHRTPAGTRSRA